MYAQAICTVVAIIAIAFVECEALKAGINGKTLAAAVGLIAGLGGYSIGAIFP